MTDYIPNVQVMQALGVVILGLGIAEIGLNASLQEAFWGPIFTIITGLLALSSNKKGSVLAGSIFSVITIVLLIPLAVDNSNLANKIQSLTACVSQSSNSTITAAPLNQPYSQFESVYDVDFFGNTNYFTNAANCQIKNYNSLNHCYCTDSSSGCSQFSFSESCGLILESRLEKIVKAIFIVAVISISIVAVYAFFSWSVACCQSCYAGRATGVYGTTIVTGELGVPTTATAVEPSIITHDAGEVRVVSNVVNDVEADGTKVTTAEPIQVQAAYPFYVQRY